MLTSTQAMHALGISAHQLYYLLRANPELEPKRIGNFRVFSEEDMVRIRSALAGRAAKART